MPRILLAVLVVVTLVGCNRDGADSPPSGVSLAEGHLYSEDHLPNRTIAERQLRGIFDSAMRYYERDMVSPTGEPLPRHFPVSVPLTPAQIPCGERVAPNPTDWQHPTWLALGFQPTEPLRYSYQFDSEGTATGARFTIIATSDFNCNGVPTVYRKEGSITPDGRPSGSSSFFVDSEGE